MTSDLEAIRFQTHRSSLQTYSVVPFSLIDSLKYFTLNALNLTNIFFCKGTSAANRHWPSYHRIWKLKD